MSADLDLELKTFKAMLPELLFDNIGKYAVICMDRLIGVMACYEDAIILGYKVVGMTPFLVKQITMEEGVMTFTRDIQPVQR